MWLTNQERTTLTVVGAIALAGLAVLMWQHRHPFDFAQDAVPSEIEGRQRPFLIEGSVGVIQDAEWDTSLAASRQVDINTASVAELERLPQIGPALASRIVEYRNAHG